LLNWVSPAAERLIDSAPPAVQKVVDTAAAEDVITDACS